MSQIPPPPPPSYEPGEAPGPSGPVTPVGNLARFGAFALEILLTFVTCGIGWLIWSIVLWQQSATPAKKILKMRVVDVTTGAPATMQQMVLRELVGKIAIAWGGNLAFSSALDGSGANVGALLYLVSGILILVNSTRQGVWDYIAKTTVVRAD